jgi:multiple sugar transport system permease protein
MWLFVKYLSFKNKDMFKQARGALMATQPESVASAPPMTAAGRQTLRRRTRGTGRKSSETLAAYLFLAPYLVVLGVFTLFVAVYGIGLSFFKIDIGITTPQWVGFRYYRLLFEQLQYAAQSDFWISMWNITKYTVFVVIGETAFALLLAVLLHNIKHIRGFFRTAFYLPAVTSSVAVSLIFLWLYEPQGGINYLLSLVGISGPHWLEDPRFALPALILLNVWTTSATFMIYFLAALQDIPTELLEAAEVDGANRFRAFWSITFPLLRPAVFLVVALGTIGAFQMFDQAKFMTNGGPLNSTLTPLLEIYNKAFGENQFGYASAMSVILFIVIFIFTLIQRRLIDVRN